MVQTVTGQKSCPLCTTLQILDSQTPHCCCTFCISSTGIPLECKLPRNSFPPACVAEVTPHTFSPRGSPSVCNTLPSPSTRSTKPSLGAFNLKRRMMRGTQANSSRTRRLLVYLTRPGACRSKEHRTAHETDLMTCYVSCHSRGVTAFALPILTAFALRILTLPSEHPPPLTHTHTRLHVSEVAAVVVAYTPSHDTHRNICNRANT